MHISSFAHGVLWPGRARARTSRVRIFLAFLTLAARRVSAQTEMKEKHRVDMPSRE